MKTVILAAGIGSRLGNFDCPKALTPLVNGKTILDIQLENLVPYVALKDIYLVVGYKKEMFLKKHNHLHFIVNPDYSLENTAKSLLRAIESIDDDILWINGDVVFVPEVLSKLIANPHSTMIVNEAIVGSEEVKYIADKTGRILEVSKEVENGQGEALGINVFRKKDIALLKDKLKKCKAKDYFEKAIELAIKEGAEVYCEVINGDDCVEIDFPEDLEKANRLLEKWGEL